jgi:2',3'-cyclic-nucleotide 2'-phosphodiesterase (5'-nucleotidase family)
MIELSLTIHIKESSLNQNLRKNKFQYNLKKRVGQDSKSGAGDKGEFYSLDGYNPAIESGEIIVPVIETNDFHSYVLPKKKILTDDDGKKFEIKYGGYGIFKQFKDIIKEKYKEKNKHDYLLWIDGGDILTGGSEINDAKDMKLMGEFYKNNNIAAMVPGNHDFDKTSDEYLKMQESSKLPIVRSNLNIADKSPVRYMIKEIGVGDKKLKIGIIGISTVETLRTIEKEDKSKIKVNGEDSENYDSENKEKYIEKYIDIINELSDELKEKCNAIILLGHIGMNCNSDKCENIRYEYNNYGAEYNFEEYCGIKKDKPECDGELFKILTKTDNNNKLKLKIENIDLISGGHVHENIHLLYKEVPIMVSKEGKYSNIAYLHFKLKEGKYSVEKKKSIIEGPIPLCAKVNENHKRCLDIHESKDKGVEDNKFDYKKVKFHGTEIKDEEINDKEFKKLNEPSDKVLFYIDKPAQWSNKEERYYLGYAGAKFYFDKTKSIFENIIKSKKGCELDKFIKKINDEGKIEKINNKDRELLKQEIDMGIMNKGTFRDEWEKEGVTEGGYKNMFPFSSYICRFTIKGTTNLKNLINIISNDSNNKNSNNNKDNYPFYGIKIDNGKLIRTNKDNTVTIFPDDDEERLFHLASNDFLVKQKKDAFKDDEIKKIVKNVFCLEPEEKFEQDRNDFKFYFKKYLLENKDNSKPIQKIKLDEFYNAPISLINKVKDILSNKEDKTDSGSNGNNGTGGEKK